MSVRGIFASNQGIVGDRIQDFAGALLKVNPTGSAPLLALTSGMQKASAKDSVWTWFEENHISGRTNCVDGGTSTTVTVGDASSFTEGTLLLVEDTSEILYVTAVSNNTLTVVRGMAGTTITSITNAMSVQDIGNAHEEGSGRPTAVSNQGHPRSNYTQIYRNSWAITGTAKVINFHTGNRKAKNKRDCTMLHAEQMERSIIWGKKHIGLYNNKQLRLTDGILAQIEQYGGIVEAANSGGAGQLKLKDFRDFMRRIFSKNIKGQPNERICFSGDIALQVINECAVQDTQWNISNGETEHGIMITTVAGPFGRIKIMTHPLMVENPVWQEELYVLHPGAIRTKWLRETFPEDYDTNGNRIDGADADQGLITSEMGVEVQAAVTMGYMTNIQTAVASY